MAACCPCRVERGQLWSRSLGRRWSTACWLGPPAKVALLVLELELGLGLRTYSISKAPAERHADMGGVKRAARM